MDLDLSASGMTEEDWERLIDAAEVPLLVLMPDLRIVWINRSARMLIGRSEKEIRNGSLESSGTGEPWRSAMRIAQSVGATRAPEAVQLKDDYARTWDVLATPFNRDASDDPRVLVVAWDVTHSTEMRAELDRREQMSLMGSLVAGVAHEVRSPLFAISATLDALQQLIGHAHREYFEVLSKEVERMTNLMQDLLEFGRPAPLLGQTVTIERLVAGAINGARALAQSRRVEVVAQLDAGSIEVFVDVERVQRALENVICNAIQHSPSGERVVVEAGQRVEHGQPWVEIAVLDRGPGIPEEHMPHLFEPFFSRRKGGTGLGLSIVDRTIQEHQGEVRATNRPSGGAAFVIRLPLPPETNGRSLPEPGE